MTAVTISTRPELWDAVNRLGSGDVIDATNLGGNNPVPSGELDGNGVRVRTKTRKKGFFLVDKPKTIVRNVTLEGDKADAVKKNGQWDYPDGESAWATSAEGMVIRESDVLIENVTCEGWTHAGIQIGGSSVGDIRPEIRNCTLTNNNCRALGYGIAVYSGHPKIEWCYFNNNRHDIGGSGLADCGYTARFNHVGDVGRYYGFEMHAPGGDYVVVRQNTFERKLSHSGRPRSLIVNRGTPKRTCYVERNWFKGKDQDEVTSLLGDSPKMYKFANNAYGPEIPASEIGQPRDQGSLYDAVAAATTLTNV